MCGIVGYVGPHPAAPTIIECLQRLQYRGYDSAGLVVRTQGRLAVSRVTGVVEGLVRDACTSPDAVIGVGHTRWATHGQVTVENAHPLSSCDGALAVVHNGIVENQAELRQQLESRQHRFRSTTDSEVIPHLLEEEMRQGASFEEAFLSLRHRLKGTYAIVAVHRDHPFLLATRRASPLVVGVGDGEYFPASDIPCFLPHSSRVLYVHEEECLRVDSDGIHRLDDGGKVVHRIDTVLSPVELSPAPTGTAGHDHYMIKEILEQAQVLDQILGLDPVPIVTLGRSLKSSRRSLFVGAGTSYHSALFAEHAALVLGVDNIRAFVASEFAHFARLLSSKDLVVLLSQSGETADTISAGRLAKMKGAGVAAIVNSSLATIPHEADYVIPIRCGTEVAVAATKSYTAQLAVILLALTQSAGEASRGFRAVKEASNSLYNLTSETSRKVVSQVVHDLGDAREVFLLGQGLQNVTARESALKLKEVAGIRAEGFFMGEMKHGPLSLIEERSPVIAFYGDNDFIAARTAVSELASRGARVYTIGPRPMAESAFHIRTDDIGLGLPIAQIAPIQLMSYELARSRGLNPDRPRNLAKSVTTA